MALLCFIPEFNFDFVEKITAIDEVGDGKISVVEQVVEGLYQVQVFGQFLVEASTTPILHTLSSTPHLVNYWPQPHKPKLTAELKTLHLLTFSSWCISRLLRRLHLRETELFSFQLILYIPK